MTFSSLSEWLVWLENHHTQEIDLGLDRIRIVAERLHLLHPNAKIITVAGTNGKGSCATTLAALIQASGHSVGLYTSPHLLQYNERVKVNGELAGDDILCAAFEKIQKAAREISLSYFEYGTLAAFEIFNTAALDYWVLEVGLGGRLDAVNLLDADIAIITSIALDHEAWLGNDREKIGFEKAGILREKQFFICADENPPASVEQRAHELQCQSFFIDRDFSFECDSSSLDKGWHWFGQDARSIRHQLELQKAPHLPWPSVAAALQAAILLGLPLVNTNISRVPESLTMQGRFQQMVRDDRQLILDVAHNPAATAFFAHKLQELIRNYPTPPSSSIAQWEQSEPSKERPKIHALVAMMADKEILQSLTHLFQLVDSWHLLDLTKNWRAARPEHLESLLIGANQPVNTKGCIANLWPELLAKSRSGDWILIFGSFFTLAEALHYFELQDAMVSRS